MSHWHGFVSGISGSGDYCLSSARLVKRLNQFCQIFEFVQTGNRFSSIGICIYAFMYLCFGTCGEIVSCQRVQTHIRTGMREFHGGVGFYKQNNFRNTCFGVWCVDKDSLFTASRSSLIIIKCGKRVAYRWISEKGNLELLVSWLLVYQGKKDWVLSYDGILRYRQICIPQLDGASLPIFL